MYTAKLCGVLVACILALSSCHNTLPTTTPASSLTWAPKFEPTATSTVEAATATLSATLTPAHMPETYVPHPALQQIAPPLDGHSYAPRWEDDRTLRYTISSEYNHETGCYTQTSGVHTLGGATEIITKTACTLRAQSTPIQPRPSIQIPGLNPEDIVRQAFSPDRSKVLVLAEIAAPPPGLPKLGQREELSEYTIFQGWLFVISEGNLQPVFYTVEEFSYVSTPDGQYILAVSDTCYGDNPPDFVASRGLFGIDAHSLRLHTIAPDYVSNCEGSIGYRIAPDGRHLLYEPGIVTTPDGTSQIRVCDEHGRARSYVWSQDGRYAYIACARGQSEADILRRYDTWSSKNQVLTDGEVLGFKAIEMAVSPDQTHIAFVWGAGQYVPGERYGLWLIDLTQLP